MPTPTLDPAECQRVLDVHTANARAHGKTCEQLGKNGTWVSRRLMRAKALGLEPNSASKAQAARYGYSPEHDMTKTVPDGYFVKGVSTYYDSEGEPKGQWVKSSIDHERQMEIFREAVAVLALFVDLTPEQQAGLQTILSALAVYFVPNA